MITNRHKLVIATATLLTTTMVHAAISDPLVEDWQRKRLFEPTARQIALEQKGKVFVYVGLTDRDVAKALEEEFDRVDSMMFANTIVTDEEGEPKRDEETGGVVVEDDGC